MIKELSTVANKGQLIYHLPKKGLEVVGLSIDGRLAKFFQGIRDDTEIIIGREPKDYLKMVVWVREK